MEQIKGGVSQTGKKVSGLFRSFVLHGGCTTLWLSSREGEGSSVAAECGKMAKTKMEKFAPHSRIQGHVDMHAEIQGEEKINK